MSDDEPYDSDGDVFLSCPSPEAPTINSAPPVHAERHQAVPGIMAMDVVQPATNTLAPEMTHQMQQAYGAFPDPTPPIQHGGGGGGNGVHDEHYQAPTMDSQHIQASNASDGAAEADDVRNVCPDADADAEEEDVVVFKPIVRCQLDCARCRPTREILDYDIGTRKTYLAVHSTYPGSFEHAIIDGMAIGADGRQFHINELLYCDLRGHSHEWVQDFIAKNVEKILKSSSGQPHDICGPSNAGGAAACANNNISSPQPSNNPRMELEIDMLNNILPGTELQAAHRPEEATEAAGVVTHAQDNTTDAPPSVAEAAATPPESAQASVTQVQEINNVLYPSLLEQLRQQELKRQERTKLSNMPSRTLQTTSTLTTTITPMHQTLHQKRVSRLSRKIKKLEQKATQGGIGGLFAIAIKKKLESIKLKMEKIYAKKKKIYATIKRAMQGVMESATTLLVPTGRQDVAGPASSTAGPSNVAGPSGTK